MAKNEKTDGRVARSLSGGGKTPKMYLRVPTDEQESWKDAAQRAGKSLSQWLRDLANRAAKR
jgi:uncharacterized protein (DUF1778 family)